MKTNIKTKSGQALVEFSMTFGLYVALMLMAFDFASIAYQWTILQYSANSGARIGSLGYINDIDPNKTDGMYSSGTNAATVSEISTMANNLDRIDTIKSIAVVQAKKFGINITKLDVKVYSEDYAELASGCDCDGTTPAEEASKDTVGEKLMYVQVEKEATLPVLSSTIQTLLGFFNVDQELTCKLVGKAVTRNEPFNYKKV